MFYLTDHKPLNQLIHELDWSGHQTNYRSIKTGTGSNTDVMKGILLLPAFTIYSTSTAGLLRLFGQSLDKEPFPPYNQRPVMDAWQERLSAHLSCPPPRSFHPPHLHMVFLRQPPQRSHCANTSDNILSFCVHNSGEGSVQQVCRGGEGILATLLCRHAVRTLPFDRIWLEN